ncbi:MAG: hypothetical protein AB7T59_04815 [Hyphomonadaceae bacterium]
MGAFVIQVRHASLGSGPDEFETVCAMGDSEADVLRLVRAALQLGDEDVRVVRSLSESDARELGLKPFQVKHL